jgi:hypothetical protein
MPYIPQDDRRKLDGHVEALAGALRDESHGKPAGMMNYAITTLLLRTYEPQSYQAINEVMGVLACVQAEFYRKLAAPYEDRKARLNGKVYYGEVY